MAEPRMAAPGALCLAELPRGAYARVEHVHFAEAIRPLCPDIGFSAGDVVGCLHDAPLHLIVTTRQGRRTVDRFYACFVEVTRV